jgi:hypothetical protein
MNVNVRCLDPGTVKKMTVRPFNGRDWEQHTGDFIPMDED